MNTNDEPLPMRIAIKESKKSKHRFKLGAVIAKGKRVLVKAHNSRKTHPVFGSGEYNTLHAESYAIYKAVRRGVNLEGTTMYVYRQNNNLAKPCKCCMGLIHKYGIKEVVYSG
jgi:tRNA(Arg) A34 adenosine deaminase TadA